MIEISKIFLLKFLATMPVVGWRRSEKRGGKRHGAPDLQATVLHDPEVMAKAIQRVRSYSKEDIQKIVSGNR